jgi:hypothetical protein
MKRFVNKNVIAVLLGCAIISYVAAGAFTASILFSTREYYAEAGVSLFRDVLVVCVPYAIVGAALCVFRRSVSKIAAIGIFGIIFAVVTALTCHPLLSSMDQVFFKIAALPLIQLGAIACVLIPLLFASHGIEILMREESR